MEEENIKEQLEELLFISQFMINKKKYKKERRDLKKMISKIEKNKFESLLDNSGDDIE